MVSVENFKELLDARGQERLIAENTILTPHGSFNAYVWTENMIQKLYVPMFGNKTLLRLETNWEMQRKWLQMAGLKLPEIIKSPDDIDGLVIVKFPGARGGKGYFIADLKETFFRKWHSMIKKGASGRKRIKKSPHPGICCRSKHLSLIFSFHTR